MSRWTGRTRRLAWSAIAGFDHKEFPACLDKLPAPEVIASAIVDDLTAALAEFEAVAARLETSVWSGQSSNSCV